MNAPKVQANRGKKKPLPPVPQNKKKKVKLTKSQRKAARAALAPAAAARAERFFLSPCAKTYLKALCDPFNIDIVNACIPDLTDVPSQKVKTLFKGSFQSGTGTGNLGWVILNPYASVQNPTSPAWTIKWTDNTFAGAAVDCNSATTGVKHSDASQFPFTVAQLASLNHRTVACGIRVRYIGTELSRAGRFIGVRLPNNGSLQGVNVAGALAISSVASVPVTKSWTTLMWLPTSVSNDYSYSSSNGGIDDTDSNEQATLGFLVDGGVTSNTYEFEIIWHKEYISTLPNGTALSNLTSSHSDMPGLSAIRNHFEGALDYIAGPQAFRRAITLISQYSPFEISGVATVSSMAFAAARAGGYI